MTRHRNPDASLGRSLRGRMCPRSWSRRSLLKGAGLTALGLGVTGLSAPFVSRVSRADRNILRMLIWSDYLPDAFKAKFEAETGIRIRHIGYGSNEELVIKLRSTRGRGFDLVSPSADRRGLWQGLDLLRPLDLGVLPTDRILPKMLEAAEGFSWEGNAYMLPLVWGTEALAWRTDKWSSHYPNLSFGDLWLPEMEGRMMGRPASMLAGIGRYLAEKGDLPPFEEGYTEEGRMRQIWDGILDFALDHVNWPKVLWNDAETQESGFNRNGIVLGQTWDGPIFRLARQGRPVQFMSPREGAFAWVDGLAIPVGAQNTEAVDAFIHFALAAENGGLFANLTGYNSVAIGADAFLAREQKTVFDAAFPSDALDRLWPWPAMPTWYPAIRDEYRDRFVAAIADV